MNEEIIMTYLIIGIACLILFCIGLFVKIQRLKMELEKQNNIIIKKIGEEE